MRLRFFLLLAPIVSPGLSFAQGPIAPIRMPSYAVELEPGQPPRLAISRDGETVFEVPVASGLASDTREEQLSNIRFQVRRKDDSSYELNASADSNLWLKRTFIWRLFPNHIEFQHFAAGSGSPRTGLRPGGEGQGKIGRCYFLSNGVSNRWDNGSTAGHAWDTAVYADRYFSPNPNHANQFEFNIAMPQSVGFGDGSKAGSESDFRPERITGIFAPSPLFLAFRLDKTWTGIGIGTRPGEYLFPGLEYTGSRYAGASFFVDYLGYKTVGEEFASPVLTFTFAYDPLDALTAYTAWLDKNGFSTPATSHDARWHHLPVFCGWAEQTVESVPAGQAPNKLSTQANYEKWIGVVEQRGLPVGTVVIDDKWQQGYGAL